MAKQAVRVVGVTAGLGLVLTVAAASIAWAGPGGVSGLTQRIEMVHTTIPTAAHTTVEASCRSDEILTGGGYTVYSIGPADKVFSNSPVDDKTWHVEVINESGFGLEVDVFAVCLSRGKH